MEKSPQETSTEPVQLSLTDENISQADYERLRSGEKVEVEKSAPVVKAPAKAASETPDESETSETDGDEVEDQESDETLEMRPKKKSGTQRRIEKLVKQRAEAEREREYWRQEALKHSAPKQEQAVAPAVASPEDKPTPDGFETHQEYVEALTDWKLEQRDKQREMIAKETELKTEFQKRVDSHTERVKAFTQKHDDFQELMADVDDVPLSLTVQEVILASENGPELMYELAKDRKEFERICQLPAIEAARALGRLEAKLQKPSEEPKAQKPKQTTKAPPPARPISTSSANGKKSVYDEDISQAEYERIRSEQEKRRASHY